MEPYEIAAFLGAVEVVLEHARPGHAVTVQQAGGDVRSALHIRWPVVELVIERDTNIGRASFAGPQRLAVALTTMKWGDGPLTHGARGGAPPRPPRGGGGGGGRPQGGGGGRERGGPRRAPPCCCGARRPSASRCSAS